MSRGNCISFEYDVAFCHNEFDCLFECDAGKLSTVYQIERERGGRRSTTISTRQFQCEIVYDEHPSQMYALKDETDMGKTADTLSPRNWLFCFQNIETETEYSVKNDISFSQIRLLFKKPFKWTIIHILWQPTSLLLNVFEHSYRIVVSASKDYEYKD